MSGKYDRLAVMIAKAREARGWSQADLAQLCYSTDAAIAKVEAGRPPNRFVLSAVEQALGWLPGMFDYVLGQQDDDEEDDEAAEAERTGPAAAEGDEYDDEYVDEDEAAQIRELVADSTIDWA